MYHHLSMLSSSKSNKDPPSGPHFLPARCVRPRLLLKVGTPRGGGKEGVVPPGNPPSRLKRISIPTGRFVALTLIRLCPGGGGTFAHAFRPQSGGLAPLVLLRRPFRPPHAVGFTDAALVVRTRSRLHLIPVHDADARGRSGRLRSRGSQGRSSLALLERPHRIRNKILIGRRERAVCFLVATNET